MRKSNVSETSKEAFKKLDPLRVAGTYFKIIDALKIIKEGNFEQIALQADLKPEKVWKRLSELERSEIIYKPGLKVPTKNGANSYVYRLCGDGGVKSEIEKPIYGKSVSDYSKELIPKENPKTITVVMVPPHSTQTKLF
jgi:DNA-binding Lrp family transcriptional regulator